ncbi:MAG: apolipoprotein N-acyltransferase [Clostridia bacterium]|nr:apolipoprotein N-acyltransferase [Clostridia bacterium]
MVHQRFPLTRLLSASPGRLARFIMLALGGALTALTTVIPDVGLLEWISLIPAALVVLGLALDHRTKLRHAYGYGLFFFMSYYCVIYHWFVALYPLEPTGMSRGSALVVVIAGWFGLSLLQALGGGLIFVGMVLLGRTPLVKRISLLLPALAGALWCIFEWSQTFFWTGVPWGRLPIGQIKTLLMLRSSAFFGSYFVTFMIVAVNFTVALGLLERKKIKLCSACAGVLVIVNLLLGVSSTLIYQNDDGETFRVAAIQGNIASADKWAMDAETIFDIYAELSYEAAQEGAELIVWPETAMPITLKDNPNRVMRMQALAMVCEADILVGMFTDDGNGANQNALVLFRRDGSISEDIYAKRRLVPFGEYVPMRALIETLIPPLTEVAMLEEDLAPGKDSGIIDCNGVSLGSLICFDSIYERETISSVRDGAELLVLSTNDSWFYDSAALYMHLSQAKMRAIESGRYIVRAANTGISAVIDGRGNVIETLGSMGRGYIVEDVYTSQTQTLYTHIGNSWVYIMILFVTGMALVGVWKKDN